MGNKRLKKNLVFNVTYQILILFLPLVTSSYLSRIIGAEGIGKYSYTYSIALYFTYFVLLGLNTYGNRTIASLNGDREKISKSFCELFTLQISCFIVVLVIYLLYCHFFATYKTLAYIQIVFLVSALFDINWYFFGREMLDKTVVRNAIVKLITTVFIFSFVKNEGDVNRYALIMCMGYLISQLALWPAVVKYINVYKIDLSSLRRHMKPNLMMFLPVIAISIYKVMDKIMLGAMSTVPEVGFYENAEKIVNVPVAVISAFGTVMLPRVTALIAEKKDSQVYEYRDKVMFLVTAFSCAAAFGIIFISDALTNWMYGDGFSMTGRVMKYLAITVVFLGCGNVLRTQYLIPYKKDNVYIVSAFVGAVVNFIANYLLIPRLGAIGAAIGTICAELSVAVYQFFKVRKEIPLYKYIMDIVYFMLTGIVMCILLKMIFGKPQGSFAIILVCVVAGIIVYTVCAFPYMLFRRNRRR